MRTAKEQLVIRHAKAVQEGRGDDAAEAKRKLEELERRSRMRVADKRLSDQTEEGVADYFAMMFADDIRFVPKFGWFRWKGSHWEQDETGEVYGCFRGVTARLRKQGLEMPTKTEEQEREAKAFRQFVVRVRSARSHDAVLRIASRDSRLVVKRGELDQRPTLLPCLNGTVDLTTGELYKAKREDLLSRVVPVEYDPKATAPMFEAFLRRIQPDREIRDFPLAPSP